MALLPLDSLSLGRTRRGQYFSMDAIIASVIFVLAISLLASSWYSMRAQNEAKSSYFQSDADRISELLLRSGDPINWTYAPALASRAGLAENGSAVGVFNLTQLTQSAVDLDPATNLARYNDARSLLACSGDFYAEFNGTSLQPMAPALPALQIGRKPIDAKERAQVRRGVVIISTGGAQTYYYYGTMTLSIWSNKSRV